MNKESGATMEHTDANTPAPNKSKKHHSYIGLLKIIAATLFLLGLYFTTWVNYLLFHALVEIFSIVVAFCVFVIAWHSKKYIQNTYLSFIGVAYFFIAILDLLHTLSYKGVNVIKLRTYSKIA